MRRLVLPPLRLPLLVPQRLLARPQSRRRPPAMARPHADLGHSCLSTLWWWCIADFLSEVQAD